jgi:hypothetical protein
MGKEQYLYGDAPVLNYDNVGRYLLIYFLEGENLFVKISPKRGPTRFCLT